MKTRIQDHPHCRLPIADFPNPQSSILNPQSREAGYALLIVLIIGTVSLLILATTMKRTNSVAILNDRNNQYICNLNSAEAAVEKVISRLAYDFQAYGPGAVTANLALYRTNVPTASENPYWSKYEFSDGQGTANRTWVTNLSRYTGPLPSQYPGLFAVNAPLIRIVSNVRPTTGPYTSMTGAVQEDVLLALVPLTQFAIFYNGLLEFSTCATMTVNGRTHANSNIFVGSSSPLTFNGTVTAAGTIGAPANNGGGPWTFPGNVDFNGNPNYRTNVPTVAVSINMTNTHSLIDYPAAGITPDTAQGQQLLYNQAQILLLISNTTVTAKIQTSPSAVSVPGQDPAPIYLTTSWTNGSLGTNIQAKLSTNGFKDFLTLTNSFVDQREDKTNFVAQIDVGNFARWILTNAAIGGTTGKFPVASAVYPTILFVADSRTNNANQLSVVRLTNGVVPPANGGLGWSVATPNPLYVWGNYNCTNSAHLYTTNTTSAYPSALLCDALTILSARWADSLSFTPDFNGPDASDAGDTVNAAIITGIKPSTSTATTGFSGGVHNLPRLLENWGTSRHLYLNTSIINLFASTKATGQFVTPGASSYYVPPTRHFSFDQNFLDYNKVPPGIPCAYVTIRKNWVVPPPNTVTFDVSP